jgi:mannosylfructose-phosphate synthase
MGSPRAKRWTKACASCGHRGGRDFIPKEYLYSKLGEWAQNALRFTRKEGISYSFIDSHYWDGGVAAQFLCDALGVPHLHTPHSLGLWKKRQMLTDFPGAGQELELVVDESDHD